MMTDDEDWVPTEEEVRHFARTWLTESDMDRFLAQVRRDAVEEYKSRRVQIHIDPAPPQMVPVRVPCPRCGHQ